MIPNKGSIDKKEYLNTFMRELVILIESHVMVPEGSILERKVVTKFYTGQTIYNLVGLTMT